MAHVSADVSEGELVLLDQLWTNGPASIRRLTDALYPGGGQTQYATVQKQLERMEGKGFVHRDRSLFVHVFSAAVDRDELIGRRLRAMVEKLCGGSLTPILSHLSRSQSLSREQRQALRQIVEEPAGSPEPKPRRKG
jgi:predicted transcriptional regulator